MTRILVVLLFTLSAFGAPVLSSCVAVNPDATSVQLYCAIDTSGQYIAIEYGTSTGTYPYRSKTTQVSDSWGRLSLGGLAPATTYYARMRAHPNSGDLTNVGYSSEITFTTTVEPSVNPTFPSTPTEWTPTTPDPTGAKIVLMKLCGSYPCADGAVPSLSIADGASLATVLAAADYTTIIRFPRGFAANVEAVTGDGNHGWDLPAKAVQSGKTIDDATHGYVILETAGCNDTAYFPPYGSRIESDNANLATLTATLLAAVNRGQHFQVDHTAAHHYWLRCLKLSYPAGAAATEVNPNAYRHSIFLSQDFGHVPNLKHFVIDRVVVGGVDGTKRVSHGIYAGAANTTIIGSDVRTGIWRPYAYPTATASVGGTGNRTLTVTGNATYQLNSSSPVYGAASGFSAVVTSAGVAGNLLASITSAGVKIYYDTRSLSGVACTNCTAVGAASDPFLLTYPADDMGFVAVTVSSAGALTVTYTANNRYDGIPICTLGGTRCEMAFGIETGYKNPGPIAVENSYVSTTGLAFYVDGGSEGAIYDLSIITRRSWFNIPRAQHWNNVLSNGYRYSARQHWEVKRGRNILISGNVFTGQFSYQNTGPSIFLSGRGIYTNETNTGISDVTIRSNTIAHAPTGWECSGNYGAGQDGEAVRRVLFENNLVYDLNRFLYNNGGPGDLNTGYFTSLPGCQGVRYRNNTHGSVSGIAPHLMYIGGDDVRGGRLDLRDNIFYYSQGDASCVRHGVTVDDNANNGVYPRLPVLSGSTVAEKFDSFWAKIGASGTTANNTITNNLMIGGRCAVDAVTISDLSQATVTSVAAGFPAGNLWPAGNTLAARESAAGLTAPSTYDYRLTAGSTYTRASADKFNPLGANLDVLRFEQGQVQNIAVTAGYQSITARYLAPDTRACSLDVSSNSGSTWTRATDVGGAQQRTVSVSGLSASTAYTWRIWCYYAQTNDGRQWDSWPSNQITTGAVTTAATATMTLSVGYSLNVTGATKARVTVYKADGTSAQTTCTSSPCSVAFTKDAAEFMIEKLSAGDVVLSAGARQRVVLQ